jgi:hypothetical protein
LPFGLGLLALLARLRPSLLEAPLKRCFHISTRFLKPHSLLLNFSLEGVATLLDFEQGKPSDAIETPPESSDLNR